MKNEIKRIGEFLHENDDFLITSHFAPDGDNLGSCIAMYLMLTKMGKSALIVNEDPIIPRFKFLLKDSSKAFSTYNEHTRTDKYENVITLDTANIDRIGKVRELFTEDAFVVNIDHHYTNSEFGSINLVNGDISSAAQIVLEVFEKNGFEITKETSDAIMCGVLTDTGGLRFQNTNTRVMKDIVKLMEYGSDLTLLTEKIFMTLDYDQSIRISEISSKIVLFKDEKIAVAYNDQKNNPLLENEPILMILGAIAEADVSLFVREQGDNKIKVSLRSKSDFNVSDFASKWGGGGHKNAAGMRYSGTIEEFNADVLGKLKLSVVSDQL